MRHPGRFLCWLTAALLVAVAGWWALPPGGDALPGRARRPLLKEEHFVSPRQLALAGAKTGQPIGPLTVQAATGEWLELPAGRPLVVVFIKHDCPCSVEFEPYFQRLCSAYGEAIRFVGVIDTDVAGARDYVAANRVPYPVLADPDLRIIHRFEAEHGSYLALVRGDGALAALWPGLSATMLQEVSGQIARLAEVPEQFIDVSGAPTALMTGCPYGKD